MSETNSKPKVLVIGWDAADWKVIHPLLDKGKMPNLSKMIDHGVMGDISTLHPVLSPMLWTSIATGKRPYKHGICGFIEPTPDGMKVQPITNLSRRTKAVWNILNQNNKRSMVVGWWPSHPAEPLDGVMVSNRYQKASTLTLDAPWPILPGTVHPNNLTEELAEVRLHPAEVTEEILRMFIPLADRVDQDSDRRLWSCASMIAECTSIHGAVTHLMETQAWDFTAVYYDAIDHFSHAFMKYHPPQREGVSDEEFEIYQHVVECGYIFHDMMLGRLLELAGEDTTVILLSDHGFHPDHLRPRHIPSEPAGPAIEHRDFGIFVMTGPGIRRDELIHGVSLLDIAPTVLHLFGLPVGEDMDGRVVADAFESPPVVDEIPSWDDVEGPDGRHPPERKLDAQESQEALQQLVDLGYVEPLQDDQEKNVDNAICELNYNLARSYIDAHRYGDAVKLLHELYLNHPAEYRYGIQLAMCFKALDRKQDLHQLVSKLEQQRVSDAQKARGEVEKWRQLIARRRAERGEQPEQPASEPADPNAPIIEPKIGEGLLTHQEQLKYSRAMGLASINRFALDFLKGFTLVSQGHFDEGIELLERTAKQNADHLGVHLQLGDSYLRRRRWDEAQAALEKAYKIDSKNPYALLGLARCHLGRKENKRAIELALESVGQMFFNPMAHYYLGVAFHRLGKIDRAIDALQLSLKQNPNNARAHGRLGYIYKQNVKDPQAAYACFKMAGEARASTKQLRQMAEEFEIPPFDPSIDDAIADFQAPTDDEEAVASTLLPTLMQGSPPNEQAADESNGDAEYITVVTGLPRSGTSMMMQMLAAGGLPVMSDGQREADDDNPKGYFEIDEAKQLATNNAWVANAQGQVIKVVAQLLPYLPKKFKYRIIFMDRAVEEVLASQKTMLSRNDQSGGDIPEDRLRDIYARQVRASADLLKRNRIPTYRMVYGNVVADPAAAAEKLNQFFDGRLDVEKMAQAVDPSLHRQKTSELKNVATD